MSTTKTILISCNLQSRELVKRGKYLVLREDVMQEHVYSKLDPIWHSTYDQLLSFTYCSDGTYMCQKRKKVIDKIDPSKSKWIVYNWYEIPDIEAKPVYSVLKKAFEISLQKDLDEVEDYMNVGRGSVKDSAIKQILELRNGRLLASDWMFTTDSQVDSETLEKWKIYRQKLRDIPEDNKNIEDHLDWEIPYSPDEKDQFEETLNVKLNSADLETVKRVREYLETENYTIGCDYLSSPLHYHTYRYLIQSDAVLITEEEITES
jgi:hypothetical protein